MLGKQRKSGCTGTSYLGQKQDDLLRLQQELIDAVTPFTEKTGTAAAYVTTPDDPDINQPTIDYQLRVVFC
jgi:hypothetical protein